MPSAVRLPDGRVELVQVKKAGGVHLNIIGWCDGTVNLVRAIDTQTLKVGWHCSKKSAACQNCYAEGINRQHGTGLEYKAAHVRSGRVVQQLDEQRLAATLAWKKPKGYTPVAGDGRLKIFVADMIDLFDESVPAAMVATHYAMAVLRPDIDWLLLTKVPSAARALTNDPAFWAAVAMKVQQLAERYNLVATPSMYMPDAQVIPPENVWLGVTAETQDDADRRLPELVGCVAAVKYVSIEPLLDDVELDLGRDVLTDLMDVDAARSDRNRGKYPFPALPPEKRTKRRHVLDWAIVGCESLTGVAGRQSDAYHARAERLIGQCVGAGVAVYHKQWPHAGKVSKDVMTLPEHLRRREWPKVRGGV